MPLPTDANAPWPPKGWGDVAKQIDVNAAWYSGDEEHLARIYSGSTGQTRQRPSEGGGVLATAARWFWGRRTDTTSAPRQRLHAPAAADVASTSADLLFGVAPTWSIPEAHGETPDADAKATEARLLEIVDQDGIDATLLEAAEIAGGLSGVYLRPVWDKELAPHPMLTVVHADHAYPEFTFGRLRAVTFSTVLLTDGAGAVWRHLERYEPGKIMHGLYVGRSDSLGARRPLTDHPVTAELAAASAADETIVVPGIPDRLIVSYVPAVRPNRRFRNMPLGRAHTEGSETFMDALDEAWTAWMRELRLVKPRIIVPNDFLTRAGRGMGAGFDLDQEVFAPLDIDPATQDRAGITVAEFTLHTDQYARSCAELFEKIVVTAGFSPSTFGLIGDTSVHQTATQVAARQDRTEATVNRMQRYWRSGAQDQGEFLLILDREVFSSNVKPMRPRLDFAPVETDEQKVATTVSLLRAARAISVQTAVQMAQPELEGDELAAEVERILAEDQVGVPDPTGGLD